MAPKKIVRKRAIANTEKDNDEKAGGNKLEEEEEGELGNANPPDLKQEEQKDYNSSDNSHSDESTSSDSIPRDSVAEPKLNLSKKLEMIMIQDAGVYTFPKGKNKKSYKLMITEAIEALNERHGSSFGAIKKWINANYPDTDNTRMAGYMKKAITIGLETQLFYHPNENSSYFGRLKLVKKKKESRKIPTNKKESTNDDDDDEKIFKVAKKTLKPDKKPGAKKNETKTAKSKKTKMVVKKNVGKENIESEKLPKKAPNKAKTDDLPKKAPNKAKTDDLPKKAPNKAKTDDH